MQVKRASAFSSRPVTLMVTPVDQASAILVQPRLVTVGDDQVRSRWLAFHDAMLHTVLHHFTGVG